MNIVLWVVQVLLTLLFLGAAIPKITGRGLEQWTGFSGLPRGLIVAIGVAELFGSTGLVLPMATGFLPWLTPLAAIGLATNVLMATGFHVRADERLNAVETTLWATIAAIVAIGRWNLVEEASVAIAPGALIAALAVLFPAAVVNVIVLLRRPSVERSAQPLPR